jgi:hypothetical protein
VDVADAIIEHIEREVSRQPDPETTGPARRAS